MSAALIMTVVHYSLSYIDTLHVYQRATLPFFDDTVHTFPDFQPLLLLKFLSPVRIQCNIFIITFRYFRNGLVWMKLQLKSFLAMQYFNFDQRLIYQ